MARPDPSAPDRTATPTVRLLLALAGIAGLVVAVVVFGSGDSSPGIEASADAGSGALRPALGPADAPIVMEVWSDFGCSFCARHALEVEPALVSRHVEPGTMRIEYYDFPVQGPASVDAAVAARAAGQQGRWFDYASLLFTHQHEFGRERLLDHARQLDLDLDQFARDLDSPLLAAAVERDLATGQQRGVRATPTFLLNDQPVFGAQPTSVFEEAIAYLADSS